MSISVTIDSITQSLRTHSHVELSAYPEHPYSEKAYKLINHQMLNTTTGHLLILEVEENGENRIISIPDIQDITLNSMSSENHEKYYLSILNRSIEREYQDLLKSKASGSKRSQDDLELIKLEDKRTETLRIVISS